MKGITTILFDIDGTILDTREFILSAIEHTLSTLGYKVPERSVIASNVGRPFLELYFALTGSYEDIDELKKIHHAFQLENHHLSIIYPNTLDTLNYLKKKKYKIAAVSTRSNKTTHQTLQNAGIFDLFDVIVSGEDAKELKPNPAPLFLALERLGELPGNAVMVGDSHLDIQAGKNAGAKTIRAIYGFHQDYMHDPEPDFFISDISDLLKLF